MLVGEGDAVGFRHELARRAVERTLSPDRRVALHRVALAALLERGALDPARLAHHADAAGDMRSLRVHARSAGDRAARLGAHREAARQYSAALRALEATGADEATSERTELLELVAYQCYLTDRIEESLAARVAALAIYRAAGDAVGEGDTLRWISRLQWFAGRRAEAEEAGAAAIAALQPAPPGRELAMALSNAAQLAMLADDWEAALSWGGRAIELAERLGDAETLSHALNNVGAARALSGDDGRSRGRARAGGCRRVRDGDGRERDRSLAPARERRGRRGGPGRWRRRRRRRARPLVAHPRR